jgi:hypothetical protein
MYLIKALVLDTWISYWHVLLLCMLLSNLRVWIGSKWIVVAFVLLFGFVVTSEATARIEDNDFIYLIGAVIRFVIASIALSIAIVLGVQVRRFWGVEI